VIGDFGFPTKIDLYDFFGFVLVKRKQNTGEQCVNRKVSRHAGCGFGRCSIVIRCV
jgi:hypothetical protein